MFSAYVNMAEWLWFVSSEPVSMVLGSARSKTQGFYWKIMKKMLFSSSKRSILWREVAWFLVQNTVSSSQTLKFCFIKIKCYFLKISMQKTEIQGPFWMFEKEIAKFEGTHYYPFCCGAHTMKLAFNLGRNKQENYLVHPKLVNITLLGLP